MLIKKYLEILAKHHGSDLYFCTGGAPPNGKFQGTLKALSKEPLKPVQIAGIIKDILDDDQKKEFE
jgi:twitching motility protein PilU